MKPEDVLDLIPGDRRVWIIGDAADVLLPPNLAQLEMLFEEFLDSTDFKAGLDADDLLTGHRVFEQFVDWLKARG